MADSDIFIKQIGKGGQGCVELVIHDGERVARKEVKVKESDVDHVEKEIEILKELRDRNVLIFKDAIYDDIKHIYYIYTEYFKNGSLSDIIKKQNDKDFELPVCLIFISFQILIDYMINLVNVMKYIHGKGIIHRDIKPANILVGDRFWFVYE